LNVLVVEPGMVPYEKEINGLEEMQEIVGGTITPMYPYDDLVALVCNDDAIYLNLPFNRSVEGGYGGVFGTFFVCGLAEDSFGSLTPEQVQTYKQKFRHAEILLGAVENTPITLKVPAMPKNNPSKQQGRDAPHGKDR